MATVHCTNDVLRLCSGFWWDGSACEARTGVLRFDLSICSSDVDIGMSAAQENRQWGCNDRHARTENRTTVLADSCSASRFPRRSTAPGIGGYTSKETLVYTSHCLAMLGR